MYARQFPPQGYRTRSASAKRSKVLTRVEQMLELGDVSGARCAAAVSCYRPTRQLRFSRRDTESLNELATVATDLWQVNEREWAPKDGR